MKRPTVRTSTADRVGRYAGWLAILCCGLAAFAFGVALEGYSHARHPLSLLGASGTPRALAFNLLAFVVPGLIAATMAIALRSRLPGDAVWPTRIGARLLLLSAFAFTAQGLLPLDPADLDGPASQRHALAWTLWWIAAGAGALLSAVGSLRLAGSRTFAWAALSASILIFALALAPPEVWRAGIAQRIAVGAWLMLFVLAGHVPGRRDVPQP